MDLISNVCGRWRVPKRRNDNDNNDDQDNDDDGDGDDDDDDDDVTTVVLMTMVRMASSCQGVLYVARRQYSLRTSH